MYLSLPRCGEGRGGRRDTKTDERRILCLFILSHLKSGGGYQLKWVKTTMGMYISLIKTGGVGGAPNKIGEDSFGYLSFLCRKTDGRFQFRWAKAPIGIHHFPTEVPNSMSKEFFVQVPFLHCGEGGGVPILKGKGPHGYFSLPCKKMGEGGYQIRRGEIMQAFTVSP